MRVTPLRMNRNEKLQAWDVATPIATKDYREIEDGFDNDGAVPKLKPQFNDLSNLDGIKTKDEIYLQFLNFKK